MRLALALLFLVGCAEVAPPPDSDLPPFYYEPSTGRYSMSEEMLIATMAALQQCVAEREARQGKIEVRR